MRDKLLVLGAGPYQLPLIRKARDMGLTVVATDGDRAAPGLREADVAAAVDLKNVQGCIDLARAECVAGVTSVAAEVAMPAVAAVAEAVGVPGPGRHGAAVTADKLNMRRLLRRHGIASPDFRTGRDARETLQAAAELGYPVVVKPRDSGGSRGVSVVQEPAAAPAAWSRAIAASRLDQILVEEFVPGPEVSVEGFVVDERFHLLALSDKWRTPPPFLMDTTVVFPSEQPQEIQTAAVDAVRAAVETSGLQTAAIHAEVLVDERPGQPVKVVEFACRGAGFHVFTTILPWVTGKETLEILVALALGRLVDLQRPRRRGAVLRFPQYPPGVVRQITGLNRARAICGIRSADLFVGVGDRVETPCSGSDRTGYLIALDETRASARDAVRRAEETLTVTIDRQSHRSPAESPREPVREGDVESSG